MNLSSLTDYAISMAITLRCTYLGLKVLPGGSMVKNLHAKQKMQVWSLGWEAPLEKGMATHLQYSCLENPKNRGAWLQSLGLQKVWHDWWDLACKEIKLELWEGDIGLTGSFTSLHRCFSVISNLTCQKLISISSNP